LLRDEFFDDLPLLVRQIRAIMQLHFHVTPFVNKVAIPQKRKRNMVFGFPTIPIPTFLTQNPG
jgi:hypothetical protein